MGVPDVTAVRLCIMIKRGCSLPDERGDIKLALDALGLDAAKPNANHPLADLYQALHLSARLNEMVLLERGVLATE